MISLYKGVCGNFSSKIWWVYCQDLKWGPKVSASFLWWIWSRLWKYVVVVPDNDISIGNDKSDISLEVAMMTLVKITWRLKTILNWTGYNIEPGQRCLWGQLKSCLCLCLTFDLYLTNLYCTWSNVSVRSAWKLSHLIRQRLPELAILFLSGSEIV